MAYIAGQKYNGMTLNQAQADRLNSQTAQLAGTKTAAQAQAEREAATAKSLQGSKTINNFGATAPEQVAAQTAINQKYNLAEGTGIAKSLGGLARIAMPTRTQELVNTAPTAQNPMKEVSARGANTQTISGSGTSNTPIVINKNQYTTSQFADTRNELVNKQNEALTLDDYFNMSPEQQKIEQLKRGQEANQAVSDLYGNSINDYDTQITEQATQKEAERAKLEAETATKIAENDALLEAQRQQALNSIESAAKQRGETAANTMAFQGFGRSTKAVEVQDQIAADRQAQIADLESKFTAAKAEYKAKLLDTIDEKLKVYDENIKDLRSEKSKVEAEKLKQQGEIIKDLIKNDPTDPTNQLAVFEKISNIKLNLKQYDLDVQKETRESIQSSLENSVKYGLIPDVNSSQIQTLASNMNMAPDKVVDMLNNAAQKAAEEKTKYSLTADGQGGMYVFDPSAGRVIGRYDMFGNYTGEGGSTPPFATNTGNTSIDGKNVAGSILGSTLTQTFGVAVNYEKSGKHGGLDYVLPGGKNAAVQVPISGTVIAVEQNKDGFGNSVIVKDAQGREHRFSHLSNIAVQKGQQLQAGESVGNQGNSGYTKGNTGIHVDYRIKENGSYIDPKQFLSSIYSTQSTQTSTGNAESIYNQLILEGDDPKTALAKAQAASKTGVIPKSNSALEKENAKPSDVQNQSNLYANRLQQAIDIFDNLESQGFNFSDSKYITERAVPNNILGVSTGGFGKSNEIKQQEQAERNFINAILRRESGAAIAQSEFDSAALQYFPQPGDTPEVLAQKKANRRIALEGLKQQAGNASQTFGNANAQSSGGYYSNLLNNGSSSNISDNDI